MSEPLLDIDAVSAVVRTGARANRSVPRDLPDLARFLLSSLAKPEQDEITVLSDVTLRMEQGCLAVLGEEGSGKSSLVALLARLLRPSEGVVRHAGVDIHRARGRARAQLRARLQIVLDDEDGGLDPRLTLRQSLRLFGRALHIAALDDRALQSCLERVGLSATALHTTARELSAGDVKRAALARALLAEPALVVLDEPTRGLDPLERAALLRALASLRPQVSLVVATRDIDLARVLATHLAVLDKGRLVEHGETARVLAAPAHAATRGLLGASPQSPAQEASSS